jgi:hypothetical protein
VSEGRTTRRGVAALVAVAAVVLAPVAAQASGGVSVTSVSPGAVGQNGTVDVTVDGSGFAVGDVQATVAGTGVTVTNVDVLDASSFIASISAAGDAAPGPRTLTVTVAGVGSGSLADAVTVDPAPTLTAITPSHVLRGTGRVRLRFLGTGFEPGMRVSIPGSSANGVATSVTSSTSASARVAFAATALLGPHSTTLLNPDGGYVVDLSTPVVDGPPRATGLSIASLDRDETTLATVTGTGFLAGARVTAGPGVTTIVRSATPTSLTVSFRAGDRAPVGRRRVTVIDPDGGTTVLGSTLRVDYQPIFVKWAVGDGATAWTATLRRPTFTTPPTLSFSGRGVTASSAHLTAGGQAVVALSVGVDASPTWRTMTIIDGTSTWVVPRGLKVRLPPVITGFPSLAQGTSFVTVTVTGRDFEVCAQRDPTVSVGGGGVTVNMASPALGDVMYVNVSVAPTAATGPRDVTMTNCDSGGTATSIGVFTVTAG